ncbi:Orf116 [Heliothis zea nudivirus]|uniref:Orf116 n=1 Tax=Heliothis zea nudivirus 1 TaxID=3116536 RepID=Q8JKJ7_9VIRU|nr:Orf116 [Heliothis zea nudivirus]AAN04409.1 Orf116 [Heliothis zea nudivirus]
MLKAGSFCIHDQILADVYKMKVHNRMTKPRTEPSLNTHPMKKVSTNKHAHYTINVFLITHLRYWR